MSVAAIISACLGCGIISRYMVNAIASLGKNVISVIRAV